jgi:hypothetical protein
MVPSGLSECGADSHRPHPQVFHYPRGAELWGLASQRGPRAHELANGLRQSTTVPSQI